MIAGDSRESLPVFIATAPAVVFDFDALRMRLFVFPVVAALLALTASVWAAESSKLSPRETEFFEAKIRPVLVENCYKCHSQGAEKVKGGLLLDTRTGLL